MHSSGSTCCDYDRLCSCNRIISRLHVEKNRACRLALFVLDVVIATKLFGIIEEQRTVRYAKEEQIELMFSELLLLISRAVVEGEQKDVDKDNADVFSLVCDYISAHLMEDLTIERLSKEFFVSKSYLSHLFQNTTGLSLHKFIQKKRLAMQRDAIKGGMSIAKVYAMSGMKDYSTFYRAFKKEYGVTPSEFARSVHKNRIES